MSRRITRTDLAAQIHACCEVMGERGERVRAMLAVWQWQGAPEEGEVGEFCEAAERWLRAEERRARDVRPITEESAAYYQRVSTARLSLRLDMGKSNLMARVLYGGEAIRPHRCPVHAQWVTLGPDEACPCDGTGWMHGDDVCPGALGACRDTFQMLCDALGTATDDAQQEIAASFQPGPKCSPNDAACEIPGLETMRPIPERAMDRAKLGMCFVGNCEEMP